MTVEKLKSAGRREHVCLRVKREIVIPAGTMLRQAAEERGGRAYVEAVVGLEKDFTANFVVQMHDDAIGSEFFEKVIAQ